MTIAASTVGGEGSCSLPASSEPAHHVATPTGERRQPEHVSLRSLGDQKVPGASSVAGPTRLGPADCRQHAVQHAGVGLLIGDRAGGGDTVAITIAVGPQRCGALGCTGERRDGVPFRIRRGENLLGLAVTDMKRATASRWVAAQLSSKT